MVKQRTLEDIDAEIEAAVADLEKKAQVHQAAAEKREALIDERDEVKVAGFDQALVALANERGVNPKNFATEAELRSALETSPSNED